jgi:hypothetical protein
MVAEARQQGATIYDGEVAIALRAIEAGARETRKAESGDTAYLDLMRRLLQVNRSPRSGQSTAPASSLILP